MPRTASLNPDAWLDILARLPADIDIDELARSTRAIQGGRCSRLHSTVGWNALRLRDAAGDPFDLIATLRTWQTASGPAEQPQEWAVQALCDRARSPRLLPLRLIILPLPPDKTASRHKKLRRTASKH